MLRTWKTSLEAQSIRRCAGYSVPPTTRQISLISRSAYKVAILSSTVDELSTYKQEQQVVILYIRLTQNFFAVHLQIIRASISPTKFDDAALSAFEYPFFSIFSGVVLWCVSLDDVDGNILLLWSNNWGHYIRHLPRLTKILQVFTGTQNCQQCTHKTPKTPNND